MSLDVSLEVEVPIRKKASSGIFIRESGGTREISVEEWNSRFPDKEPVVVAGDEEECQTTEVFSYNITHNLGQMARECDAYEVVWQPKESGITKARQLVKPLQEAIAKLKGNPEYYKQFNPANNWGNYEGFLMFLENYLQAAVENPDSNVSAWR